MNATSVVAPIVRCVFIAPGPARSLPRVWGTESHGYHSILRRKKLLVSCSLVSLLKFSGLCCQNLHARGGRAFSCHLHVSKEPCQHLFLSYGAVPDLCRPSVAQFNILARVSRRSLAACARSPGVLR